MLYLPAQNPPYLHIPVLLKIGSKVLLMMVLFVGIILGHFGFTVNHNVIHFFKEFGLILFVYSVGMQVGPAFFRHW